MKCLYRPVDGLSSLYFSTKYTINDDQPFCSWVVGQGFPILLVAACGGRETSKKRGLPAPQAGSLALRQRAGRPLQSCLWRELESPRCGMVSMTGGKLWCCL